MKKTTVIVMGLLSFLWGCQQPKLLTETEAKVCQSITFDEELAGLIKQQTGGVIAQLPEISEYGEILGAKGNGICATTEEDAGYGFVLAQKETFRKKGYLLFLTENNENQKLIAAIKGTDELDIVKWRQTNGINYDHENSDVVAKLAEWKQADDFVVLGASMDWVHIQFISTPKDVEAFAKEVYEFCPDAIDQGAGDMPTLISSIKAMNGVFLWWD
jgi:hypothetical protein